MEEYHLFTSLGQKQNKPNAFAKNTCKIRSDTINYRIKYFGGMTMKISRIYYFY